ncbi:MAG: ABC transporter substrate-binding protein, partial [Candidatus Hodarchaeota archaeon]
MLIRKIGSFCILIGIILCMGTFIPFYNITVKIVPKKPVINYLQSCSIEEDVQQLLTEARWSSEFHPYGAYVDELQFKVYLEKEINQSIIALQNGDIDAYDERVLETTYLVNLVNDPNIQVTFTPSVRYRALTLNCDRFPTNITAFRRAMAFGMDKYRANKECIQGVGLPLDSHIPIAAVEWEIESEMSDHFYETDYISGNASLEVAGFSD